MELLENLHDKPPIISHFFGRRYHIEDSKTVMIGMPKSGISSIIIDFLSTLKKGSYLYIDLSDPRVDKEGLEKLELFIKKQKILHLVIENYTKDFTLPNIKNITLTSSDRLLKIKNFKRLEVKPLNFEEFIGFQQRHFDSEHIFNTFTAYGNLPKNQTLNEYENIHYLQDNLKNALHDTLFYQLFSYFAINQSKAITFFKAYNFLKSNMKVSKDKLYKAALKLEQKGFLHYIQKYNLPNSPKKVYLSDFAYKSALTYKKDFLRLFENMVFCELSIHEEEIFYTDEIHFYLPNKNQAILCIPFLPPELILRRFAKIISILKSLQINSLQVVTIGNEGSERKDGILCEIVPFWEWALMF